jgi:soluble lytic murein transglycosylase-like protein
MRLTSRKVAELANAAVETMRPRFKSIDPKMWKRVLVALAWHESKFDPVAKNRRSSALGLMQILKGTQLDIERRLKMTPQPNDKLKDPGYSMLLASYYIAWLYVNKARRSWDRAIVAYNQGHYNLSQAGETYRRQIWKAYNEQDWNETSPFA